MTVLVERDNEHIVILSEFRDKDLCKAIPGSAWKKDKGSHGAWTVPLAWSSCIMLRAQFEDRLVIGPELKAWAKDKGAHVKEAMQYREALEAEPVPGAHTDLFPHQHAAVRFMHAGKNTLIADQMGTGKTAQAITAVSIVNAFPCLIICPRSVIYPTWVKEFKRWYPQAKVEVLRGGKKKIEQGIANIRDGEADVGIINWEALRIYSRLAPYGSMALSAAEKTPKALNAVKWQSVIADEAHKLISPKSAWTRAAWWLAQQDSVLMRHALTGTPMANHPDDLWSILHFCDPEEFPTKSKYVERYCMTSWSIYGSLQVVGIRPEIREEWEKIVHPHMRSIPIDAVRKLPPLENQVRMVELTPKQKKAYEQMEKAMVAQLDSGDVMIATNPVAKLTRLSQFASANAMIVGENEVLLAEPSNKLDELDDIIDETGDEPIIVFAESRQLIMLAAARMDKRGITYRLMVGGQKDAEREAAVNDFQEGRAKLILCTMGAGSVGITLTRSRIMVFLERSWKMINNVQAEGRGRRIGSEIHDNITIIDIVSEKTIDERRLEVKELKTQRLEDLLQHGNLMSKLLKGK